jgi:integrase
LLETKKSQLIIERQAIGTGFIPAHKYKSNFLDYYEEFVKNNQRKGNRHLIASLIHFKAFIKKDYISPIEITENLSVRFRQYLLDNFNGDTPANYFARFKRVLKNATKEGYFRISPSEEIAAKANKNKMGKEHLEADEYIKLINTPFSNEEIKEGFIFCCYTGLRYCDARILNWTHINGNTLTTTIIQEKTGEPLKITLHKIALAILAKRKERLGDIKSGKVFNLPSNDGCNQALQKWCAHAKIDKHITWHCARLSFSILLQDKNVDAATVALLLGHTNTKYVLQTYKRHRPKDQSNVIAQLPTPI